MRTMPPRSSSELRNPPENSTPDASYISSAPVEYQHVDPSRSPAIFGTFAPLFWAKNIPVMPLRYHDKRPIEYQWSQWATTMPSEQTRAHWMAKYPHCNIGLPAGAQSRCVFIDIDSPDPRVTRIINTLLPKSPWVRVGQKGFVAAYRHAPELNHSFKIKDKDNNMLVEFISNGGQVVVPPSIHPKTNQPYTETCSLFAVIDELPVLPQDLEKRLREALIQSGIELSHSGMSKISSYVPAGARDNTMVSLAGILSMDITRGQLTLAEALSRMEAWYQTLTEKVEGDALDIDKGQAKIVEFLQRDVLGEKRRPLPLGWDLGLDPEYKAELEKTFTKEHQEWSHTELMQHANKAFMTYPDRKDPRRLAEIEYTLDRISRSPSITSLQKEQLFKYLVDAGRIEGMTVVVLRKRLKELQSGKIEGLDHTEIAKAVIADFNNFGELRMHIESIWQWKGAHWEELNEGLIYRHIAEEYGSLMAAKKQGDHKGIMSVIKTLIPKGLNTMSVSGVNFANYFLTLEGQKLKHAPEFGATYTLPYRHVPQLSTSAPLFQRLLHDAWGHDADYLNKVQALREFIATTMTGTATLHQRCILLFGVASTGKSTILNIVKELLPPEMISVVAPKDWGDKYAPAMMAEKLLNVAGELHEKHLIDGEKFKQIIDGSEMFTQAKYKDLFKFKPKAAHWFASNHLPRTNDTSSGFNRRWLILEFNKPVLAGEKVIGLDTKIIMDEREAIVAWALESLEDLKKRGDYTIPFSSELLINEMACENNSVRFFLTECPKIQMEGKNRLKQIEQLIYGDGDTRYKMSLDGLVNPQLNQRIYRSENSELSPNGIPTGSADALAPTRLETTLSPEEQALLQSSVSPLSKNPVMSGMSSGTLNAIKTSGTNLSNGLNLISEDQLHKIYLEFCSQMGGVRPAGLRVFKKSMVDLKHELGYQVQTIKTSQGLERHLYKGITLA